MTGPDGFRPLGPREERALEAMAVRLAHDDPELVTILSTGLDRKAPRRPRPWGRSALGVLLGVLLAVLIAPALLVGVGAVLGCVLIALVIAVGVLATRLRM